MLLRENSVDEHREKKNSIDHLLTSINLYNTCIYIYISDLTPSRKVAEAAPWAAL